MPIRVLIADDHEVVRIGLRSMFAGTDVEIVAEVGTGTAALETSLSLNVCPMETD
jgi:DNA-binding NarL/FixJ family response regulator